MLLLMLLFWPGGSKPTASKTLPAKAAVAPLLAVAPFDAAEAKAHQQAWSKYLGVPVECTNSIGMKFMLIPPGEFMMGSPESEEGHHDAEVLHRVRLTKPFYLASCEVTQEQYLKVMGTNPSSSKGDQQPVEEVSWQATAGFLHLLSSLPKERRGEKMYRLPTEAEWEYACRAGTTSRFSFGSSIDKFPEYSWPVAYSPKASKTPRPVGKKFPNPWKLYDLYANVSEWCQDYYGDYPSLPVVDPKGPLTGAARVRRGGGHMHRIVDCRSASRLTYAAKGNENLVGNENLGFRVVLEIPVRAQPNTSTAETTSLPPSLTKRLVTRPPFRDNIKDVILALSFDGDEVVTQEGKMCLKDSSPLGNIVHTNSAAFVSTPTGEGLVFDGFDDTVLVKNFRSQITQKKEGLTVACLLKTTKPGYVLDIGADGQQLSLTTDFQFMPGGTNPWIVRNEELSPQLDQWLLLVGTWDGIKVNTYVNGEIYRSRNGRVQGPISDRSFPSGDSTLVIGQQHKSYRRTGRGFGGVLDELLFFKRALSAAEVKTLYEFEKP
jgi:formylglycine-generating enzyme required for sulfatase activity